jgi:hypothetical protein
VTVVDFGVLLQIRRMPVVEKNEISLAVLFVARMFGKVGGVVVLLRDPPFVRIHVLRLPSREGRAQSRLCAGARSGKQGSGHVRIYRG